MTVRIIPPSAVNFTPEEWEVAQKRLDKEGKFFFTVTEELRAEPIGRGHQDVLAILWTYCKGDFGACRHDRALQTIPKRLKRKPETIAKYIRKLVRLHRVVDVRGVKGQRYLIAHECAARAQAVVDRMRGEARAESAYIFAKAAREAEYTPEIMPEVYPQAEPPFSSEDVGNFSDDAVKSFPPLRKSVRSTETKIRPSGKKFRRIPSKTVGGTTLESSRESTLKSTTNTISTPHAVDEDSREEVLLCLQNSGWVREEEAEDGEEEPSWDINDDPFADDLPPYPEIDASEALQNASHALQPPFVSQAQWTAPAPPQAPPAPEDDEEGGRALALACQRVEAELLMARDCIERYVAEFRDLGDAEIAKVLGDALAATVTAKKGPGWWVATVRNMARPRQAEAKRAARGEADAQRRRDEALRVVADGEDVDALRARYTALPADVRAAVDDEALRRAKAMTGYGSLSMDGRKEPRMVQTVAVFREYESGTWKVPAPEPPQERAAAPAKPQAPPLGEQEAGEKTKKKRGIEKQSREMQALSDAWDAMGEAERLRYMRRAEKEMPEALSTRTEVVASRARTLYIQDR